MGPGLSRPNCARSAATVSGVADCPSASCAASPGRRLVIVKITAETMSSVSAPTPMRFRTRRAASALSAIEPHVLGEHVAHEAADGYGAKPFHLRAVAVEEADEHRDADAAFLVDEHLHVGVHLLALRVVGLGARRDHELVELLVLPSRLVPRRIRLEELREELV